VDLLALSDWLLACGCTHVAIESTGDYWKPVFNILEGICAVILVNAQHVKAVPGRKTDVKAVAWLAELLQHGLWRASFISAAHLASWAGVAPGNHEIAGKRMLGKARKGNRFLRTTLVQAAHAAARTKGTYLSAQYRRLAARQKARDFSRGSLDAGDGLLHDSTEGALSRRWGRLF
jgi:transposase